MCVWIGKGGGGSRDDIIRGEKVQNFRKIYNVIHVHPHPKDIFDIFYIHYSGCEFYLCASFHKHIYILLFFCKKYLSSYVVVIVIYKKFNV